MASEARRGEDLASAGGVAASVGDRAVAAELVLLRGGFRRREQRGSVGRELHPGAAVQRSPVAAREYLGESRGPRRVVRVRAIEARADLSRRARLIPNAELRDPARRAAVTGRCAAHVEPEVITRVRLRPRRVQFAVQVEAEDSAAVAGEREIRPDAGRDLAARRDDVAQRAAQPEPRLTAVEVEIEAPRRGEQTVVIGDRGLELEPALDREGAAQRDLRCRVIGVGAAQPQHPQTLRAQLSGQRCQSGVVGPQDAQAIECDRADVAGGNPARLQLRHDGLRAGPRAGKLIQRAPASGHVEVRQQRHQRRGRAGFTRRGKRGHGLIADGGRCTRPGQLDEQRNRARSHFPKGAERGERARGRGRFPLHERRQRAGKGREPEPAGDLRA